LGGFRNDKEGGGERNIDCVIGLFHRQGQGRKLHCANKLFTHPETGGEKRAHAPELLPGKLEGKDEKGRGGGVCKGKDEPTESCLRAGGKKKKTSRAGGVKFRGRRAKRGKLKKKMRRRQASIGAGEPVGFREGT